MPCLNTAWIEAHALSDATSAQLVGGRGRPSLQRAVGGRGPLAHPHALQQSLGVEANQLNFAINIAVNGGSIVNTQLNGLAIDASI